MTAPDEIAEIRETGLLLRSPRGKKTTFATWDQIEEWRYNLNKERNADEDELSITRLLGDQPDPCFEIRDVNPGGVTGVIIEEGALVSVKHLRKQGAIDVPWSAIQAGYSQICSHGILNHRDIRKWGAVVCAMLSRLPGAKVLPYSHAVYFETKAHDPLAGVCNVSGSRQHVLSPQYITMSNGPPDDRFFCPDVKELGLAICYVLEDAGGALSFDRVAEVLGDFLQIPSEVRSIPHETHASHTEWTYVLAWTCSSLRKHGFMARNKSNSWGMCVLTEAGQELGRWAQRIYGGENADLPEWVRSFLRPLRTRMRRLLKGGEGRKPPDYELCRWVRYCYLLNWPKLGVAIFNLILSDFVDPPLWRQAERQARILRHRIEDRGGNDDGGETEVPRELSVEPTDLDEFRELVTDTFPPGTRIANLVRRGHNEIREFTDQGVLVLSSRTRRENLIAWTTIHAAYRELKKQGVIYHWTISGRSCFLCSLLARLPGAEPIEGECGVKLIGHEPQSVADSARESVR